MTKHNTIDGITKFEVYVVRFITKSSILTIVMVDEFIKDFLDLEKAVDRLGWYTPTYYFIFLFYFKPNFLTFILMVGAGIFCYSSIKSGRQFSKEYIIRGRPDFNKILKKEKIIPLLNRSLSTFLYISLSYGALIASLIHLVLFIKGGKSGISFIILIIIFLFLAITTAKYTSHLTTYFNKEFLRGTKVYTPYVKKKIKKLIGKVKRR